MNKEELLKNKLPELKALAKERGIDKVSGIKKEVLIDMILSTEVKAEEPKVEEPVSAEEPKEEKKETRRAPRREVRVIRKKVVESDENKGTKETPAEPVEEKKEPEFVENASGILEVSMDGFGFLRQENLLASDRDVYVSPGFIKKLHLKTGDYITGCKRDPIDRERYESLTRVLSVNYRNPIEMLRRTPFENLTPIFPDKKITLERQGESLAMRVMDLVSPIGKGQRGLIVSPPKAGKTTMLKDIAVSILRFDPKIHLIILLIDERPEEVTDIKELIKGEHVEIVYSTFDELPERHKRVSEMTIEHAKRLVESGEDVVILLDSITRLARAYNLTEAGTGRTLSGGLDPSALYMPKKFFGAARNTREKGSLTILATALIETGSKMDDVIYEEFKGTGNMELILSRKLQERRLFPAIDIARSGTRREDLLLNSRQIDASGIIHRTLYSSIRDDAFDRLIDLFIKTRNNEELVSTLGKNRTF